VNVDSIHELWTKYLAEGVLLPEEEQELVLAFRANPALAEQLVGDIEIDGLLRTLPENKEEAEASARRFLDGVKAESDADRFVDQVFTRITTGEPKNPSRPLRQPTRRAAPRPVPATTPFTWRDLAIAAAALIVIGIAYQILSPAPPPPPARRAPEIVRPTEPRAIPSPEIPAPPASVEPEKPPAPREPEVVPPPAPPPVVPPPAPAPEPKPAPPTPKPVEKVDPPSPRTITTVAAIEKIEGDLTIGRVAAKAGDAVPAGEPLETAAGSSGVVKFSDGTRIELGPDTLLSEIADRQSPARGRRVTIARGSLVADVSRQPADQPMTFATPHGEARILGTKLRLDVGKTTRVEVKEGRVRFTRPDGRKVEVAPGQFALAADLAVKPVSQERRVLYQWDFEEAGAGAAWSLGTIDKAQTFGGSRGALKAFFRPDADYAVHAQMAYLAKPMTVTITENTTMTFAYFISAPVELKVQVMADKTKPTKTNIAHIITAPKANSWTVVTLKLTESFRIRAGLGDLVKPGPTDLDNLQFHAGPGDKPVDLFIDNVAIFE
jgi:hypothetical protein